MKKSLILLSSCLLLLFACKKDKSTTFDLQEAYFPIVEGHYVIYQVKEVKINDSLNQNDTTNYFLKTLIGAVETDNSGRPARRFERYIRYNANDPWILKDIWTTIRDGQRVELVEENQRVIKLVLAPDKVKEWDMNAYNMLGKLNCYYENIHEPATVSGYYLDSTVKVVQDDVLNFVQFKRKSEVYAKRVGMVKKVWKDYVINNYDSTNITSGNEIQMLMISHGKQ